MAWAPTAIMEVPTWRSAGDARRRSTRALFQIVDRGGAGSPPSAPDRDSCAPARPRSPDQPRPSMPTDSSAAATNACANNATTLGQQRWPHSAAATARALRPGACSASCASTGPPLFHMTRLTWRIRRRTRICWAARGLSSTTTTSRPSSWSRRAWESAARCARVDRDERELQAGRVTRGGMDPDDVYVVRSGPDLRRSRPSRRTPRSSAAGASSSAKSASWPPGGPRLAVLPADLLNG